MSKNDSVHIKFTRDLLNQIDDFKSSHYFSSRSDAIRFLVTQGLRHHQITDKLLETKSKEITKLLKEK